MPSKAFLRRIRLIPPIARTAAKPASRNDCPQNPPADGIARRGGRSPSAARKLPQQKPRSPRGMLEVGKPLKASPWEWRYATSPAGSSGGSAEGASEGRQPLTGPHLPPPEAAKTAEKEKPSCPQGTCRSIERQAKIHEQARTPVRRAGCTNEPTDNNDESGYAEHQE